MDAEVLGGLFRAARRGLLDAEQAPALLAQLVELPIERVPLAGLVGYAWPLRHNVSANDALYVALARQFGCPLITADRRLAGAPDLGVPITVIS